MRTKDHRDGARAFRQGRPRIVNPYLEGSETWRRWDEGWKSAERGGRKGKEN